MRKEIKSRHRSLKTQNLHVNPSLSAPLIQSLMCMPIDTTSSNPYIVFELHPDTNLMFSAGKIGIVP